MIVGREDRSGIRLPPEALAALLEAARDGAALRTAGRRTGEEIAREAGGDVAWDAVAATWAAFGLGSIRRERPRGGVWLLGLDPPTGASAASPEFWEEVLAGLLGTLAGEPFGVVALPPGVGPEVRFAVTAPDVADRLRQGLSAGWTLERIVEGA
jgi:hypothetical protein